MIRLGSPSVTQDDIAEVARVLRSGLLVQGVEVEAFEADLKALLGVANVVVMNSCTAALEVALRAVGVGTGDIVITSAYSWIATANVIEVVGATPCFVDIDEFTYNIDSQALEQTVNTLVQARALKRVKAILPVHAFGYQADLENMRRLATELGVPLVEDAACALGARIGPKPAGTIGEVGCFSFHPRKSITSGEGGALVTNDASIAAFARSYRNHGQTFGQTHVFERFGHNYRLTEPMAALARSQLSRLPQLLAQRRAIFELYRDELEGVVGLPKFDQERHAAQAFVVLLPENQDRERIRRALADQQIETGIGTIAIPFTEPYRDKYEFQGSDFPSLRKVATRALALPLHSNMSVEEAKLVVTALIEALELNR
jgi:dTDP-4-amino-4,6-dideoxygalactose transaminase